MSAGLYVVKSNYPPRITRSFARDKLETEGAKADLRAKAS